MKVVKITARNTPAIVKLLRETPFFTSLKEKSLELLLDHCELRSYDKDEVVAWKTDSPDSFFIIHSGSLGVFIGEGDTYRQIVSLDAGEVVGEIGLLLNHPRTANVMALEASRVIYFDAPTFQNLLKSCPSFPTALCTILARRLISTNLSIETDCGPKPSEPAGRIVGKTPTNPDTPDLDQLLIRMVAEEASDVHLTALHQPYWRVHGEMRPILGTPTLGTETVLEMFENKCPEMFRNEFLKEDDVDFAYELRGAGRFRVNLFRDTKGIGAVLRHIPERIKTIHELGLPDTVRKLCEHPKGLVLVTGPTGSGKSTTLAGMVDYLNKTRRDHIITLEDPVEFVHETQGCLVNQREIGSHTKSFARALKAALREDPDIVLVGEMRDIETVQLALETANTGHFVMATLHTSSAVSTIDRIIDLFPAEQQNQVRSSLADCLIGVITQTLCKATAGGRVAALEILVINNAVANLIRTAKVHQIPNMMQAGRKIGNQQMNDDLARLVKANAITADEAMVRSTEKGELAKLLGVETPE